MLCYGMGELNLETIAAEFESRKRSLARLRELLGPMSYRELGKIEGANVVTLRAAIRDGVTDNHDRGVKRKSPPRDELLRSVEKTMAPLTSKELARRLREFAESL